MMLRTAINTSKMGPVHLGVLPTTAFNFTNVDAYLCQVIVSLAVSDQSLRYEILSAAAVAICLSRSSPVINWLPAKRTYDTMLGRHEAQ